MAHVFKLRTDYSMRYNLMIILIILYQVNTSVNAPLQPAVMRTHHTGISSDAIIFYDITGRRIGSSPSTGIISRSSGILLRRDKNGYSIMAHMSDK
jgi:hypothetical protein